jgi:predicted MPP superfamily phosphohydrolase
MVNGASPDLIVFTGDIVSISPQELRPFTETLSRLHPPCGIVSILGNHDYCTYGPRKSASEHKAQLEEVIAMQRQMGWNLLMNEHIVLRNGNDSIAIIGVENDGHPPFPARANLDKATEGIYAGCYKILLTHDPSHWRRAILSHTDIPLTLSGHTHAMHLRIGGWSPSALLFSEWGGLYKENNQYLHVNTGTGSNIPFRLGAWPEITIITLTSADAK